MKSIDAEITEVESRIAARKVAMGMTRQAAKTRAKQALVSPPALIGAAVAGFVIAGVLWRRKKERPVPTMERRRVDREKEQGKGFALGTLAMTGLTWLVRSQFGGPVGLAHFVIDKVRSRQQAFEESRPRAFEGSRPQAFEESRPQATGAPAQIPR